MVASARWALDHGAAVRARTRHGSTPLCFAASTSEDICRLLISVGGAPDLKETNVYGWSPMYWAVLNRRVHIQRFLLLQGGTVRREDFPETLSAPQRRRLQDRGHFGYVRRAKRLWTTSACCDYGIAPPPARAHACCSDPARLARSQS